MFCIGKKIIVIFVGVIVIFNGLIVIVKGFKGEFVKEFNLEIIINIEGNEINVFCLIDNKNYCVFYGIICVIFNNMVVGVFEGYEKKLEFIGVGYCV